MIYRKVGKRLMDIVGSLVGLILLSPLFLLISFLLLIKQSRPIFFVQSRPGLHGKAFNLYKFRTMTNEINQAGELLSNEERITNIGLFLRKTSLDEIPELWNVFKGDMSLVGPRPLLFDYVPYYNDFQLQRHQALPGITGLAQVHGRNALSWERRFEYDVKYIQSITLMKDIEILMKTIGVVLKREGISDGEHISCEPFRGTPPTDQP